MKKNEVASDRGDFIKMGKNQNFLLTRDDLSGSLVDLLVVGNEVPESRFGSDWVGSKKSHTVDGSVGLSG